MTAYLLVNFGGPRDLSEIPSFLEELLLDPDVIRTKFPRWLHEWFFRRVAKKRALSVAKDYEKIGGKSPIFFDTEKMKEAFFLQFRAPCMTFHRYLPMTHEESILTIEGCKSKEIRVVPMFPQFCYATTGSIARFFERNLSLETRAKLQWVRSYPDHPAFIEAWKRQIRRFLKEQSLDEKETILLFSAHGLPRSFIEEGDPYEKECRRSVQEIVREFPQVLSRLAYQSKFGRGEWLRPSTIETCQEILQWCEGRKNVVIVPITFTSDHIETLFEIEELYLPPIREKGLQAYRLPALNLDPFWISMFAQIAKTTPTYPNASLVNPSLT